MLLKTKRWLFLDVLVLTGSPCYLLWFLFHKHHRLFAFIFSSLISIATCAYVLLSCSFLVRIAGDLPTRFCFFIGFPCYLLSCLFAHKHRFLGFIFSFFFFQNIHRDLCLCASFLIFSFLLAIYPLRLVPMCFSLGTHCGGRRCALPPAPPHPLLFLNRFPLLPTIPFFLHKHHRLFGLISSLLISIETCAYVLLSWSSRSYLQYIHWDLCLCASLLVRIAGGGAAPSPLHPPTRFYF